MIDNYIFDLGQVIVEFDSRKIMAPYIPDERDMDEIEDVLFARKYWDRLDDGTKSEAEIINEMLPNIPYRLHSAAREVIESWYMRLPVKTQTVEIIKYLKARGKKVYLLSNISREFADNCKDLKYLSDIFSNFDGLVFSGQIGLVKPNKEIFLYALNKFDIEPETAMFIDDNINNINAAKALGVKTFLFKNNYSELRETIECEID